MKYSIVMSLFHRREEQKNTAMDALTLIKKYSYDYELIIIDNGSTIPTDWVQFDVKAIFSQNKGISRAWNTGFQLAKGEYIVEVNDDVFVCPYWLEKLEEALQQPNAGCSTLSIPALGAGKGIQERYKWFSGSLFMFHRNILDSVGYFDERFYPCSFEDTDYWMRIYRAGLKLYVNYTASVVHLEGMTVHDKDQSDHFLKNKELFVQKWGFDPIPVFYGDEDIKEHL